MCVELKLHFLLLNAVLQAPQLAEAEGTVLEQARGGRENDGEERAEHGQDPRSWRRRSGPRTIGPDDRIAKRD